MPHVSGLWKHQKRDGERGTKAGFPTADLVEVQIDHRRLALMQVSDVFSQAMSQETSQAKLKALIKGLVKSKLTAHAR